MANAFFSDLLSTISERGRILLRRGDPSEAKPDAAGLVELCEALLSGRGEASGTAMAREVLDRYHDLDADGQRSFFEALARDFGPDRDKVAKAIEAWRAHPGDGNGGQLHFASEPRRQELIRRLNRAPGGTSELVKIRADLLGMMNGHADLAALDRDVVHLLGSWFNRGFLVLRRIDWSTPANILEQIIRYEAVHEIHDWDDLRRRIDPVDRRCYAFFHPALADEPLIFVEVALTEAMPSAIAPLLAVDRRPVPAERARTAVFYSISNTQRGLGGISFGNFLIKQVVEELRRELPKLDTFVTLSPVPGFMHWLQQAKDVPLSDEDRALLKNLDEPKWFENAEAHRATAQRARAARRVLFPESADVEGTADQFGGALPSRQRRAAGADQLARRPLAEGSSRIRRHHGQLSLSPRRHREEPRGLRQRRRGGRVKRGEEAVEERGPAAVGYAAVVAVFRRIFLI